MLRVKSLQVSSEKGIDSAHKGGLNSLELDSIDHRYLLSAASDASIAGYDVQVRFQTPWQLPLYKLKWMHCCGSF